MNVAVQKVKPQMTKENFEKDTLTDCTHFLSSSFLEEDTHRAPAIESHDFNVLGDHLEATTC